MHEDDKGKGFRLLPIGRRHFVRCAAYVREWMDRDKT